jgi:hypothetical protein
MGNLYGLPIGGNPTARSPCPIPDTATTPTLDPALALDLLRRRFPGVLLWFGNATGHWWALVDGDLLEARTPEELGRRLDRAGRNPSITQEGEQRR